MTVGIKGRNPKNFYEYVLIDGNTNTSIQQYVESPALAFLNYCLASENAITNCRQNFAKTSRGTTNLRHISVAMLPSIMGHFETYQRFLFAGTFDLSSLITDFNADAFFGETKEKEQEQGKKQEKEPEKKLPKGLGIRSGGNNIPIGINSLLGYRGTKNISIGILLADNLSEWHNPKTVNRYFRSFGFNTDVYSNRDRANLDVLWCQVPILYTNDK